MSNSEVITVGTLTKCSMCNKVTTCFQVNYGRRNYKCIECLIGSGELQDSEKEVLKNNVEC